jgi:hypothetical protein
VVTASTPKPSLLTVAADIGRTVDYRPVTNDGATRAASLVAELV